MAERALSTSLKIGANAIVGLTSIGGLSLTAETIDKTTLSSTGGYREFTGGFKDGGEVPISGYFEPSDTTGQKALYDAFVAGTATAYTVLFPTAMGASWSFNGVVTAFGTGAELEGMVTFEATIKVSGAPSLLITASAGLTALALTGTGGTLSPAFDDEIYSYAFDGVTADSVTVTATAASQTLKLYVDGAYVEDLTTATPSSAIAMEIGSKKITILANEAGKTIKTYEVVVIKVS